MINYVFFVGCLIVFALAQDFQVEYYNIKNDQRFSLSKIIYELSQGLAPVIDRYRCPSKPRPSAEISITDGGFFSCNSEGDVVSIEFNGTETNYLGGEIDPEIGRLTALTSLVLPNNKLEGRLPASLTRCSHLQMLNLENNYLRGPPISSVQFPELTAQKCSVQATENEGNCFDFCPEEADLCGFDRICGNFCLGLLPFSTTSKKPVQNFSVEKTAALSSLSTISPTSISTKLNPPATTSFVSFDSQKNDPEGSEETVLETRSEKTGAAKSTEAETRSTNDLFFSTNITVDENAENIHNSQDIMAPNSLSDKPLFIAIISSSGTVIALIVVCLLVLIVNKRLHREDVDENGTFQWEWLTWRKNADTSVDKDIEKIGEDTEISDDILVCNSPKMHIYGKMHLPQSHGCEYDSVSQPLEDSNVYDKVEMPLASDEEHQYDVVPTMKMSAGTFQSVAMSNSQTFDDSELGEF